MKTWPAAVTFIADQLGLGRFGVIGISAGAKYALAVVLAVPERLAGATLASSFGELNTPDALQAAAFRVKLAVALYRHAPWLGDAASALTGLALRNGAETLLRIGSHVAPPSERKILLDPAVRRIGAQVLSCSSRQGAHGIAQEFRLMVAPWNLPLHQIRLPVTMWHGESDVIAPLAMAQALASRIPASRLHRVPNAGHVSLLVNHPAEILSGF